MPKWTKLMGQGAFLISPRQMINDSMDRSFFNLFYKKVNPILICHLFSHEILALLFFTI